MLPKLKGRRNETNLYSLENPQASILPVKAKARAKEERIAGRSYYLDRNLHVISSRYVSDAATNIQCNLCFDL